MSSTWETMQDLRTGLSIYGHFFGFKLCGIGWIGLDTTRLPLLKTRGSKEERIDLQLESKQRGNQSLKVGC